MSKIIKLLVKNLQKTGFLAKMAIFWEFLAKNGKFFISFQKSAWNIFLHS